LNQDHDKYLKKYAELAIHVGVNLQPGQRLLITRNFMDLGIPLNAAPLVNHMVAKAYQAGAANVDVIWGDENQIVSRIRHAAPEYLTEFSSWKVDQAVDYGSKGDAIVTIGGADPDLLRDEDPERVQQVRKRLLELYKPIYQVLYQNVYPWLVLTVPSDNWAAKVLPGVPGEQRLTRMWQIIFQLCRIDETDPVTAWQAHLSELVARGNLLTSKAYARLHYSGPDTDLTIGLPKGHIWQGGGASTTSGQRFLPNIPTEEIFTLPHRDQVDGTVKATKPLSVAGRLIDGFSLTFEKGRVVKATAEKGQSALDNLLSGDEGARYLGEVALVPHSSPISQSGLVFSNTLFDENAACHLALGNAYPVCLTSGTAMETDEFMAAGGNTSSTHTDFMVGSADLDIDGILPDGTVEAVFRSGEWAFNIP
jgi:aminopeptidase